MNASMETPSLPERRLAAAVRIRPRPATQRRARRGGGRGYFLVQTFQSLLKFRSVELLMPWTRGLKMS